MIKRRKTLVGLLSLTILCLSATSAFAVDAGGQGLTNTNPVVPISSTIEKGDPLNIKSPFASFTGKVVEITDRDDSNSKMISLTGGDNMPANIVIDEKTYLVNKDALAEGSTVTAYYQSNGPMILIYPPQYRALVLSVHDEKNGESVKVDFFGRDVDGDLVSADNFLKIFVSEDTKVVTQKGDPYKGDLSWKNLVVFYNVATKSIPAQTGPSKVVVLDKESSPTTNYPYVDILVNNKVLKDLRAYEGTDAIMVPLRPIAEALGYEVKWDAKDQSIRIGMGVSLTINKDYYVYMKTAPIYLGTAPTLVDGTTYVPLSFFSEVMKVNNVEVTPTQILLEMTK